MASAQGTCHGFVTRPDGWRRWTTAAATTLVLTSCNGAGDAAASLDVQSVHPNGVVVQVDAVDRHSDQTVVDLTVLNGRERETELNSYGRDDRGYLLTKGGEKLPLVLPDANATLAIPGGSTMDATLVFAGKLPAGEPVTLVLNDSSGLDNANSQHGKFQLQLPADGISSAFGGGPEASVLSGMRTNPVSKLSTSTGGVSATASRLEPTGGMAASPTGASSLRTVEALKSELGAEETERGTVVSLPGDVTFDFDESSIRDTARESLDQLVELIKAGDPDGEITIEGHTDAKGDDDYNQRLSEDRANAVKAYLVDGGVEADRLSTIGLGELRPVAPNINADGSDDEAGRQRNRRVEVILPNEGQSTD